MHDEKAEIIDERIGNEMPRTRHILEPDLRIRFALVVIQRHAPPRTELVNIESRHPTYQRG